MTKHVVFPAEWYPQDAILLTWPHSESAWSTMLDRVESTYLDITSALSHYQDMVIQLHPSMDTETLLSKLTKSETNLSRCHFIKLKSNDTWTRDHGPISVLINHQPTLYNFTFNGWGSKFQSDQDNKLNRGMADAGILNTVEDINWVLEGGSIESDGLGTLLTTTRCLLNENRNGSISKQTAEQRLSNLFGSNRVLWLSHGELDGDDTDAHIDTLARFAPSDTIIYQGCSDESDSHFESLQAMKNEIINFKDSTGAPYHLIELPWPSPKFADDGHRLPATYANFLITNKQVLVPMYQDEADHKAIEQIKTAFPDHIVIGINALPLIEEHGSLHCITMQFIKGSINFDGAFEKYSAIQG